MFGTSVVVVYGHCKGVNRDWCKIVILKGTLGGGGGGDSGHGGVGGGKWLMVAMAWGDQKIVATLQYTQYT